MRPKKDNAHDARREILAAAEKCFGSAGFAGTSVQHIIDETPFSKPVIYYHFGNKEGLYFAVLEEAYKECYAVMDELPENEELQELRLRNFEVLHDLMKDGCESGELDVSFSTRDLANGIYGAISSCLMGNLTLPGIKLDRQAAETIGELFLKGAGIKEDRRAKHKSIRK